MNGERQNLGTEGDRTDQLHFLLHDLGTALVVILWQLNIALAALEEQANPGQAKTILKDALQAGNYAKDLMRQALDANPHLLETHLLEKMG
jgi:hypothetical protein